MQPKSFFPISTRQTEPEEKEQPAKGSTMGAANFVGLLFLARNVAHSAHLATRSYAKHVALNTFYDEVIDVADSFAEVYQGRYGLLGSIPILPAKNTANITEFLEAQLKELEAARYSVCDRSDSTLQQLIDNIVELYLRTLYKLRYLA
jgi:hypothetical protein